MRRICKSRPNQTTYMTKAVIFDMDGVLVDSEPYWQQAEVKIFDEVGVHLTPDDTETTTGLRIDDVVAYWYERHPWPDRPRKDVQDAIIDEVVRLVRTEGEAMPGVRESVDACISNGLALGLATSSPFPLIDAVLETICAERSFDVVCSAVNEEFGKPHPAVYLTAARRLQFTPGECLVVEDSIFGVEAGKAAGMTVIAVPAPHQFDDSAFEAADYKLKSLVGFPPLLKELLEAGA